MLSSGSSVLLLPSEEVCVDVLSEADPLSKEEELPQADTVNAAAIKTATINFALIISAFPPHPDLFCAEQWKQ